MQQHQTHLRTRPIAAGHLRTFEAVARHLNFRAAADVVDRIGREVDLTDLDSGGRFGPMLERRGKLIRVG